MEFWDVYDKDRNKTGEVIPATDYLKPDQYRLVLHVCIFNDKEEMLIQKRHKNKTIFPDLWELSITGGVLANENSREAAEREILEELGIKISLQENRVAFTFNFDYGFDDFFLIKKNLNLNDLTLQKDELTEVMWASKEKILKMIEDKSFIPYHKSVIDFIFFNKDHMKIHTQ